MSDERDEKSSFKVNDRRRFDSAGNERGDEEPPRVSPQVITPPNTPATQSPPNRKAEMEKILGKPELQGGGADINFSSFIISLATQALMQLGEMAPPDGMALEPDMEAARHTIAILGLIEEKTRGNLLPEETELLTEVLHSVRICYVRRSKG